MFSPDLLDYADVSLQGNQKELIYAKIPTNCHS